MALLFITLSAELKCRAHTDSSRPAATAVVIDELSLHEPLIANLDTDESQALIFTLEFPEVLDDGKTGRQEATTLSLLAYSWFMKAA